jgi:hypothetical protein
MTTLNVNKWQTAAGNTVNNVVQTKTFHYSTYQTFSGDNSVAQTTGLTLSITPKYSTSKIFVLCSANINSGNSSTVCRARIKRTGPSTVYSASSGQSQSFGWTTTVYNSTPATDAYMRPNSNIQMYDSPATTSACTYTLEIANNTASQPIYLNGTGTWGNGWAGSSQIILMEIAQ